MSDLALINQDRVRANTFMASSPLPAARGAISAASARRAARRHDPQAARPTAWASPRPPASPAAGSTADQARAMTAALFETILARFDPKVSGEQLLIDMAEQIRIRLAGEEIAVARRHAARRLPELPRPDRARSFKAVRFGVDAYTAKVGEPTEAEVRRLFDKYKDALPDPARPRPASRSPGRSRPSSSRSTPATWPSRSRRSCPRTSSCPTTKGGRQSSPPTPACPSTFSWASPS